MAKHSAIFSLSAITLLADSGGDSLQPHRPPVKAINDGAQHLVVHLVQPYPVNLQPGQGFNRHRPGDNAIRHNLGEVPHAAQEPVGDTRRTARP